MLVLLHTFIVLIFNVLFFNMFVGIVIEVYKGEMEKVTKNRILSRKQRTWAICQDVAYTVKPEPVKDLDEEARTMSRLRQLCLRLVRSQKFEFLILICILANTLVLALHWFNQSEQLIEILDMINIGFNIVFTVEAAVKIYALRCEYFKDGWNLYDFVIVAVTYIVLGLTFMKVFSGAGSLTTILRVFRVGRVIRLAKKAKRIQLVMYTIVESWPTLSALCILLIIFLFVFSVIGCQIFGKAKIGSP